MPLGLMPGSTYDETEVTIMPGESVVLSSDGIVEAHSPDGEMFGFERVRAAIGRGDSTPIQSLLDDFLAFTGDEWQQEDDITLLTLSRRRPTAMSGDEGTHDEIEAKAKDDG